MQTQQQGFVSTQVLKQYLPAELVISAGLCSECFTPLLLLHDGRWLCPQCKIEYDGNDENIEDRIPMPQNQEKPYFEGNFNPVNSLAFHKNLGTQHLIPVKAVVKILSRKNGDNTDIGLRAKLCKLVIERDEPQTLHNTLERASQKLKILGFEENVQIGDSCGKIVRKAYAYLTLTSKGFTSKGFNSGVLADACVYFTLRKYGYEPNPPEKIEKGIVKTNVLRFPKWLLQVLRLLDAPAY